MNEVDARVPAGKVVSAQIPLVTAVLVTLPLLVACGGGDPEDDRKTPPTPPACIERPALCQ